MSARARFPLFSPENVSPASSDEETPEDEKIPQEHRQPKYHPFNPAEVYDVVTVLKQKHLPEELVRLIMRHADYDCIRFTATKRKYNERDGLRGNQNYISTPWPYVETRPLNYLPPGGSVNRVVLRVTSRDQGWADRPEKGSWTWFEVGKRRQGGDLETEPAVAQDKAKEAEDHKYWTTNGKHEDPELDKCGFPAELQRGPIWVRNKAANNEWQKYELIYDAHDDEATASPEMKDWFKDLRNGDRLSIVPMAQYPGWRCRVKQATIDVFVDVYH